VYRTLDADKIVATISALERRISERFPGAGLAKVCAELSEIASENRERVARIARPHVGLRALTVGVIAVVFGLLVYVGMITKLRSGTDDVFGIVQGIEASANLLIMMAAAIFSLVTLEGRWKRNESLADLHELRSIVHVIDMHQLTKDPSIDAGVTPPTPSSPARRLSPPELVRYLDYCSEMLSLTAKVAALYAQNSSDPAVIEAVNDLERLTTNMSSKIWQKITIVQATMERSGMATGQPKQAPAITPSTMVPTAPSPTAAS